MSAAEFEGEERAHLPCSLNLESRKLAEALGTSAFEVERVAVAELHSFYQVRLETRLGYGVPPLNPMDQANDQLGETMIDSLNEELIERQAHEFARRRQTGC